jgi:hypothetical protein
MADTRPTLAFTPPTPAAPPAPAPLTPEQLLAIRKADERARKIRRAATVATTDASIMAVFTVLCAVSAVFSFVALLLTVALGIVTFNSFRGAARLKKFDPAAPQALALNQAFLAVAVIASACWSLYAALGDANSAQIKEVTDAVGVDAASIAGMYTLAIKAVHYALIAGTLLAQGLTGLYYWTRKKLITTYLAETPSWVVDLQRQQAAIK